jgi:hypothetical protein
MKFVNLAFNTTNPPVFKEVKDLEWITFGNERPWLNRYPDYLISLYLRSSKHRTLLDTKSYYLTGNGVTIDKEGLTVEKQSFLIEALKNINENGESISDILEKVGVDFELFNGAYLEINWHRNKTTFDVTHMPFKNLRISKEKDGYFYSEDWSKPKNDQTKEKTKFEFIPLYDKENPVGKQIYPLIAYDPSLEWYPRPNYSPAIWACEADYEIGNYHINDIKSGFYVGTIITFIGKPTAVEMEEVERQIKQKFTGTDRAGSLLLQFTRDKEGAPVISRLEPDSLSQKFEVLNTTVKKELFYAHKMNPMLIGDKTEGQLGGRTEIIESHELFKNIYIKPRQLKIEKWINALYVEQGFDNRIKLKEAQPVMPFDFATVKDVLSVNEIREMIGFHKVEEKENEQQFASHEDRLVQKALHLFYQSGELKSNFEIFDSAKVDVHGAFSFASQEDELTTLEKNILSLLRKDPLIDNKTLAKVLESTLKRVEQAMQSLSDKEIIKIDNINQEGDEVRKVKVYQEGKKASKETEMTGKEIKYSYELAPGFKDAIIPGTRYFCEKLVRSNKLYSRAEIDEISEALGYNVWEMRGGWYRKPGTDISVPKCRHIWMSHIVKRK